MDPTTAAVLSSWTLDGWLVVPLLATAAVYLRGWFILRRRGARRFDAARLGCFFSGLAAIYLALNSPIDALAPLLLLAHMVQHLLLIVVAAPLIWLAAPQLPLLVGLPAAVREIWIEPLARVKWLRAAFARVTQPTAAWTLHVAALWAWHIPQLYEAALASWAWHYVEHACFLGTALLFWWPVVQPYPSRPAFSPWYLLPYLFLAGVQGTVLSAILTFSDRVLYPHYDRVPRLWGLSALDDQALAGAIMWIPGSLAYLIPLALVGNVLLYGPRRRELPLLVGAPAMGAGNGCVAISAVGAWQRGGQHIPLTVIDRPATIRRSAPETARNNGFDLLTAPMLGRFLRWRHARLALQVPMLAVVAAVILDGLAGPQIAPLNLAGVVPWIHWRGLLLLALLAAGNVFCMACPFTAPRGIARRLMGGHRHWPRWLRSKWLAAALLVVFFWAYEVFSIWDSPSWTAWIAIAYFLAAFIVEGLFQGAAFCKYVCPIGQFNFVQSLVSPWEVRVRQPDVCQSCATKDCIRGRAIPSPPAGEQKPFPSPPVGEGRVRGAFGKVFSIVYRFVERTALRRHNPRPSPNPSLAREGSEEEPSAQMFEGCGLELFQPRKAGNMDCTFCLDCVRACPHENVGVLAVMPGGALLGDEHRSGIGRYSRRADLAALVVLLVFAAFVNAAGMVGPIVELEDWLADTLNLASRMPLVTAGMILGLVVAPALLVWGAAVTSRWFAGGGVDWRVAALRFSYSLVPLGCGMWLAHYGFHLFTSADAIIPAVYRAAADVGIGTATPVAHGSCCGAKAADWLLRLEIVFLDVGLLGSLYVAYRTARDSWLTPGRSLRGLAPWAALIVLLFAVGIWIVFQPMQMRGTMGVGM